TFGFIMLLLRPPRYPLFPYTTLFRSASLLRSRRTPLVVTQHQDSKRPGSKFMARAVLRRAAAIVVPSRAHLALSEELDGFENKRSEEHTSELQSRENLVCRLLLEKKK